MKSIKRGYKNDKLFAKIIAKPKEYSTFKLKKCLLYSKNSSGDKILCIPRTLHGQRRLTEIIIDQAYTILGHFGTQKTSEYIR